jgi:gluconolactonase
VNFRVPISRRSMLEVAGRMVGVVAGSVLGIARVQTASTIDRYAPELDGIISPSEMFRELAAVDGVAGKPAEGPVWISEGHYLLFNLIKTSQRLKYSPGVGVTVDVEGTAGANGMTRDIQGRLISAEGETRRVVRTEMNGTATVVADYVLGKRLPPPNDVVVKSDGAIYFSTPPGGLTLGKTDAAVGVYRVSPDLNSISLVADDMVIPNGLAFSPDETTLYVVDSAPRHVRAYEVQDSGLLATNSGRVFADMAGPEPGGPDGMKVDTAGNIYVGGAGGLYVLNSMGRKLGRIVHGLSFTTNVAFGGDDWRTLYFTTRSTLNMINVKIAGIPVPPKRMRG